MSPENNPIPSKDEPPVFFDADHAARLQDLAFAVSERIPEISDRILREIERATVVPAGSLPAHVVSIGSSVTYRDNALDRVQSVTLVMPADADIGAKRVSVLTPIGAALIGLSEGAEISWATRGGEVRWLTVLEVTPAA
ncbi:nucleoside diphosphate kinase regulator [Microbaculum marinisediminis]|uniref:Nucleoside diphosphate kinase regulator n=1 Tax=Microbaculum marinisediminis TaxID=2931392 RepID=A0AAW5R4R1_9HYPH|nr:nucleoside diphosphate kinase regulator [Microbaculum sp. A6E488]MCT8974769.1 nucleoside diphosphate kinase regulator [Microbaculum sp. A6E488]